MPTHEDLPDFNRITKNPGVLSGKPCIRGLRISVGMVLSELAGGQTVEEILADFPYLEREDIMQALQYGAWRVDTREVILPPESRILVNPPIHLTLSKQTK